MLDGRTLQSLLYSVGDRRLVEAEMLADFQKAVIGIQDLRRSRHPESQMALLVTMTLWPAVGVLEAKKERACKTIHCYLRSQGCEMI